VSVQDVRAIAIRESVSRIIVFAILDTLEMLVIKVQLTSLHWFQQKLLTISTLSKHCRLASLKEGA